MKKENKKVSRKKLKIALVAPLWFPIPPKKYGGTEWIVYHLCEGLKKNGHDVTLFASGDSKVPCKLSASHPKSLIDDGISWTDQTYNLLNLSNAFKRADEFDIIHTHVDLWEVYFPQLVDTPTVHTIHNPLYSYSEKDSRINMLQAFKNNNYVAISNSHRKLSRAKLNFVKTVYNGNRMSDFEFNANPKDHFIWCARIDKYKGIETAIEIAKKAGVNLVLAGRLDPTQENYFKKTIKPQLGKQIKYIGEYSFEEKSDFFRNAKGLIYPINWHEPFGLNMTEAMACGTPVVAFGMGSVPEVVKHGKTGFVVKNVAEAVKAVKKIDTINRQDCRDWVEKMFSTEVMVKNYEELYYELISKKSRSKNSRKNRK